MTREDLMRTLRDALEVERLAAVALEESKRIHRAADRAMHNASAAVRAARVALQDYDRGQP